MQKKCTTSKHKTSTDTAADRLAKHCVQCTSFDDIDDIEIQHFDDRDKCYCWLTVNPIICLSRSRRLNWAYVGVTIHRTVLSLLLVTHAINSLIHSILAFRTMVYISVNKASPFPPLFYPIHTLSQVYVGPLEVDFCLLSILLQCIQFFFPKLCLILKNRFLAWLSSNFQERLPMKYFMPQFIFGVSIFSLRA